MTLTSKNTVRVCLLKAVPPGATSMLTKATPEPGLAMETQ